MDRKQKGKIPECGDLPDISRDPLAVGAKQLKKAVRAGKATWVADMADLGRACGIEVGAAAAAVLKILPENSVE